MAEPRDKSKKRRGRKGWNPSGDRVWSLDNKWIAGFLLFLFLGAMLTVLSFQFDSIATPELGPEEVGTIATQDYRATHDFTYNDVEATKSLRQQKANSIPTTYRWDVGVADTSRRRIREAFDYMRAGIQSVRETEELSQRGLVPPVELRPPTPTLDTTNVWLWVGALGSIGFEDIKIEQKPIVAEPIEATIEAAIDEWCRNHRGEFDSRMLEYVDADTFNLLVRERFEDHLERDLLELVESVLEKPIVVDRRKIEQVTSIKIVKQNGERQLEAWIEDNLVTILGRDDALNAVDKQAKLRLAKWTPGQRLKIAILAKHFVQPNLQIDVEQTAAEREAAYEAETAKIQHQYQAGQIIVDEGHQITAEHIEIYNAMVGESTSDFAWWSVVGLTVVLVLMLLLVYFLLIRGGARPRKNRDTAFLATTLLAMTALIRLGAEVVLVVGEAWQIEISELVVLSLPFAAGALMIRLVQDGETALIFSVVLALLAGLVLPLPSIVVPYAALSGIVGTVALRRAKTRMTILQSGMLVGVISGVVAVGLVVFEAQEPQPVALAVILGLCIVSGVAAAILVTVGLPIVETIFGYTTDIKLLELANLEHPALKHLLLEAPGTYHHSMMVGSLNEAAAEAIGANALLARVGAYYHDIGKMKNAQYFAENQRGENAHDKLKPNMSALILKAHVKDGIEMAQRKYKLPYDLIDFIATHHGTSRIEFFYQKAKRAESPDIPEVREEDYRYPGPRPQSRETGICMIADTVEAAARALPEKTPARLRLLVQKLINHKFADGQFDECDLTLRDLNAIGEAMLHILNAVYHRRPEYPDAKKKAAKENKQKETRNGKESGELPKLTLEPPSIGKSSSKGGSSKESSSKGSSRSSSKGSQGSKENGKPDKTENTQNSQNTENTETDEFDEFESNLFESQAARQSPLSVLTGDGANPDAPVGRVRTDRSSSGEHRKIDLPKGHG